jgi:K+-sensing histidine kinase KdpD
MLPNERTTREEIAATPGEVEGLIVAPDRSSTRPLVAFLRGEGINVQVVNSPDQGFEEALLHRPNVVLIDAQISDAGGVDLCERLKANVRTHFLPIILFSRDKNDELLRLDALAAGADALFTPATSKEERRARLWALLRSQAIFRRLDSKRQAQNSKIGHKRRWVRGLIHDIQNSLGAIHANFEYIAQLTEPRDRGKCADLEECLQETRVTFRIMVRDLRTVLEFERFESGDVSLREGPILLSDITKEVSSTLQLVAADAHKEIIVDNSTYSVPVRGDAEYLKEAVSALAVYVLRQADNKRCYLRAASERGVARLLVYGDRHQIPAASRERFFDPYPSRANDKSSRIAHRVGLALAHVIVQAQHGSLSLEDTPLASTAFVIELPSHWSTEEHRSSE